METERLTRALHTRCTDRDVAETDQVAASLEMSRGAYIRQLVRAGNKRQLRPATVQVGRERVPLTGTQGGSDAE